MSFFPGSKQNQARIAALAALEQKRLAFAGEVRKYRLGRSLLTEQDGGFIGVAEGEGGSRFAVSGPAPGCEGEFTIRPLFICKARVETRFEEPEGAGGYMGVGKKGGEVLQLVLFEDNGEQFKLELMPDVTCFLFSPECPLVDSNHRRKNANIVWNFRPQGREACISALTFWTR